MESWREFLYPLGFLAAVPFTARFLLQWMISESQKQSVVTKSFWILSLMGNILLALHSLFQIQYNIFAIQIGNGVISWRNLNLMQPYSKQYQFRSVIAIFAIFLCLASLAFLLPFAFSGEPVILLRNPQFFGGIKSVTFGWHLAGTIGMILFTSRFWVQWWQAERHQRSMLTMRFWILSLAGAILSVVYFLRIGDPVNAVGPAVGIIPYLRNLFLLKKTKSLTAAMPKQI